MSSPQSTPSLTRDNDRPYDVAPRAPHTESSVAAELSRVRVERGLDTEQVSNNLRIRREHLTALEEGRFDDLPGSTYVVGFLRSYAEFLGFDGDEVVRRFKEEESDFAASQSLRFPTPNQEGRIPGVPLILGALVVAGIVFFAWHHLSAPVEMAHDPVPDVPSKLAADVSTEPPSANVESDLAVPARQRPPVQTVERLFTPDEIERRSGNNSDKDPLTPAESNDESSVGENSDALADETTGLETPDEEVVDQTLATQTPTDVGELAPRPLMAGAEPTDTNTDTVDGPGQAQELSELSSPMEALAATPEGESLAMQGEPRADASSTSETETRRSPRVFGERQADTRIRLLAKRETWVQVTDERDQLLLTRILRPGDIYFVPNRPGLEMMTGNAGGLELSVDGRVLPALGPLGTVRRGIELDAEKLVSDLGTP